VGCSFSVFVWVGGQTVVKQQREKSKIFRGGGKRVEMRGCPAKPEMQFVILCNDLWQLIAAPPLAPRNFPQCAPDRKTRKPQYLFFVAIFSFRVFSDICFLAFCIVGGTEFIAFNFFPLFWGFGDFLASFGIEYLSDFCLIII